MKIDRRSLEIKLQNLLRKSKSLKTSGTVEVRLAETQLLLKELIGFVSMQQLALCTR